MKNSPLGFFSTQILILHVIFFYFGRKPNFSTQRNFRTSLKIFLRAVFENEGVFVENHGFQLHFWSQISKMESVEVKLAAYILRWVRNRGEAPWAWFGTSGDRLGSSGLVLGTVFGSK